MVGLVSQVFEQGIEWEKARLAVFVDGSLLGGSDCLSFSTFSESFKTRV